MMKQPPRLLGVVFDLDGTLVESHPMAIKLIGDTIAAHGGPMLSAEEVVALFGPNEQGILRKALGTGWEEAWESYLAGYRDLHTLCPQPFPGIAEVLEALRGHGCRMGLVTGKTATTARISLEVLGIAGYFGRVEGGALEGVVKAECIGRLLEEWDLPSERVAYVGDTIGDIRESRAAGVVAIAAAWSEYADREALLAEEPDALFHRVPTFAAWAQDVARPEEALD